MKVEPAPLIEQVKSRLLPLTPWESILEWLVERLPRRLIRVELIPNDTIVVVDESKGEYKGITNAPSFEMTLAPASHHGGWYYLEAALVRNNGSREAGIHVDRGRGDKKTTLPIPTNLRGTVREVFFLPADVVALQWAPTAAPGFFSQSQLLIHKITPLESTLRRMFRVLFDLWRFRGSTVAARSGLTWWGALCDLQEAYQRTTNLRIKRLAGNDYSSFIALNDTLKETDIQAMRDQMQQFALHPVISLVVPVQAPTGKFFQETLESISGQIYPHWELLLAGDFLSEPQTRAIADEYRKSNVRVKIVPAPTGVSLTETFNLALTQAQGEYIARIDQHDLLSPHTLFFLAQEINRYPDTDLLYTDDDTINENGERLTPRFKPDWNPDLFFSHNYIASLTLYRCHRVLALGGYRLGYEGAEDYDLSLRSMRETESTNIRHIAKILYHCRLISRPPSPVPLQLDSSNTRATAHQSAKLALNDYFAGSRIIVDDGPAPNLYHIQHPLPEKLPLVSIIIPTRDRVELLKKCITSIQQKTAYKNWEILVVDNQSEESLTHTYFEEIQCNSQIRVIRYEKPFNYSALNNHAVQYAAGKILVLMNNDVEVMSEKWLTEMVSHAIRPEIGAVGAKLLYANGLVQHAGVILGLGGVAGHAHKYIEGDEPGYCHRAVVAQNLSAVTGACLVVRKECYNEVGGLNEDLAVAFNDIDFCLKLLSAGYRNIFTPFACLYHHESMSRGQNDTPEKNELFRREFSFMKDAWGKMLQDDPAYNQNLTLEFENFSLRSTSQ